MTKTMCKIISYDVKYRLATCALYYEGSSDYITVRRRLMDNPLGDPDEDGVVTPVVEEINRELYKIIPHVFEDENGEAFTVNYLEIQMNF